MTPVFSGGLVYEYSQESSDYGLVTIKGDSISELDDFDALKKAYAATSNPSGDGGYEPNGTPSQCPPASADWNVTTDALPTIPSPAKKFMTSGAGPGPGLSGPGSQTAGTPSQSFQNGGSSPGSSGKQSGASGLQQEMVVSPVWYTVLVLASSFLAQRLFYDRA
jgi:hypothetical protein